ncbi:MAG: zinc ribbon domain-containing protein [Actinomycetia bacterium]|nr:zinc ribbon domain-containing protein [Actinomycetes bacterium]
MTIGGTEWVFIIVVVLVLFVIFGPKQLPKLGKMFGKTMKSVRTGLDEMNSELKAEDTSKPVVAGEVVLPAEPAPATTSDDAPLTCANCGTICPPNTKFCTECGAALGKPATSLTCASCGATAAPGTKFCPDCGTAF